MNAKKQKNQSLNLSDPLILGMDIIQYRIRKKRFLAYFREVKINQLIKKILKASPFSTEPLSTFLPQKSKALLKEELYEAFLESVCDLSDELQEYFKAYIAMQLHEYDKAVSKLDVLYLEGFYHQDLFTLRATAYLAKNALEESELNCIFALAISQSSAKALFNYALFLLRVDDPYAAKFALKYTLTQDRDFEIANVHLGKILQIEIMIKLKRFHHAMQKKYKFNILAQIRILNYATRNLWLTSHNHRKNIMKLIDNFQPDRLAIFGAGNCNHYDLNQLAVRIKDIKLIDCDKYALGYARRVQKLKSLKNISYKYGVDLTEILKDLYFWTQDFPDDKEIASVIKKAEEARVHFQTRYDLVISDCIFNQILYFVENKMGSGHKDFSQLINILFNRHIELLLNSVRPGGTVLFLTEVISSVHYSSLENYDQEAISALLDNFSKHTDKMLKHANVFHLKNVIQQTRPLNDQIKSINIIKPWVWFYPGVNYIVSGLAIKKSDAMD